MFLKRKVDRRVPAIKDDAQLGLITCVWDRTGQMAKQSIPEWRESASVVSEVASEEKKGINGVERTVKKNMTNDGMIFEAHKRIVKLLSHMCDHIWRASVRSEKKCACVRTVKCSLYIRRRVHGSCHCLDAKLPERTKNLRSVQDNEWRLDSGEFDNG